MTVPLCVVGSLNMDLVLSTPRWVRPGETLLADSLELHPGGKGGNQAVAASRFGANVTMVGRVGDDDWGRELRTVLAKEGVDLTHVQTTERSRTGLGVVTVLPGGENSIVIAAGANASLTPADVDAAGTALAAARVLLLQGEVPEAANLRAIQLVAKDASVILNAAPARELPVELLQRVDVLVVNREEACALAGCAEGDVGPRGLCRRLGSLGPDRVVVTLGAQGAVAFDGASLEQVEAFSVEAVDTTGAGDAFVGVLAVLRAEGARLKDAVRLACAAGSLAAATEGAIPSLPSRDAVEARARASTA